MAAKPIQCAPAIDRRIGCISHAHQRPTEHFPGRQVIFDDQYRGAARNSAMLSQYRRQALSIHGLGQKIGGAQWDRHPTLVEDSHHDHGYVTEVSVSL